VLTEQELGQVKGLLHYLNESMAGEIKPNDIDLIDSNGERAATIGFDASAMAYVLKAVYVQ